MKKIVDMRGRGVIFYYCPKGTEREEEKMKKKMLKMLDELCISYKEYEKVEFHEELTLTDVIEISAYTQTESGIGKKTVFIVDDFQNIFIYKKTGELWTMIEKQSPEYITLARLSLYLGCWGF